jgi:hypothetical protein
MSGVEDWIQNVYGAGDREKLRELYDQWADHYDADMLETGYLHYAVMAGLVARFLAACGGDGSYRSLADLSSDAAFKDREWFHNARACVAQGFLNGTA